MANVVKDCRRKQPLRIWLVLAYEIDRRHFRVLPNISDEMVCAAWAGVHLLVCGVFLAQAAWHLCCNFGALAASSTRRRWWKGLT